MDDCNAAILAGVGVCEHRDGTSLRPSAARKERSLPEGLANG